ncbi:MAG: hypothetical protein KGL35_29795 [Bradyrhizobium sp.]|uniref:hypothetical protein n=1 Tax=Bradyrhizobium sp. TaxID=376 RepID=UPI001C285BA6|nr:hypothetical protein [Bradyrhizobium sp.]MBU6461362.1 hypothetical protein [Pseudomonadota bacterium]MDE2066538.1 hypothetical protein [Bradyrhizobium sp.]MDE2472801.1 hypothetical protein [Bradyrhizobium sp.]
MLKRARPRHSNRARLKGATIASNELGDPAWKPKSALLAAPFYLAVDRQLKSEYDTYDQAEKAAIAIKRRHPRLLVSVYEAKSLRHIAIEESKSVAFDGKRTLPTESDAAAHYPASSTRH